MTVWHSETVVAIRYYGAIVLASLGVLACAVGPRSILQKVSLVSLSSLAWLLCVACEFQYPPSLLDSPVVYPRINALEFLLIFSIPLAASASVSKTKVHPWMRRTLGAGLLLSALNAIGLTDVITGTGGFAVAVEQGPWTLFSAPLYHLGLGSALVLAATATGIVGLLYIGIRRERSIAGPSVASGAILLTTILTRWIWF